MSTATLSPPATGRTPGPVRLRLSVMMFLQYFVQGCYLPIVSLYLEEALGFSKGQIGTFFSALALGPLFAPFVLGQLVDRRFAMQRVLAACHFSGGMVMLALYLQQGFWPVVILGTLYSILYVPSLMLTNSLAFHHLKSSDEEFPRVRVWGTIGFIVPAWLIEMVFLRNVEAAALNDARGIALAAAGVSGFLMAAYCLMLPHTPPARQEKRRFAPAAAAQLVRLRPFLVLVTVSFFVAIVHKFYFVLNSPFLKDMLAPGGAAKWVQRISSLGQIGEILVIAALALFIRRLGFKSTMLIGIAAYGVRCLVFSLADELAGPFELVVATVCLGQLLHGLCFGCFLAAAFMYLDRTTPGDLRGSVQNLYGTFVLGVGFVAGGFFAGAVGDYFTVGTGSNAVENWSAMWNVAAGLAGLCFIAFAATFPRELPVVRGEATSDEPDSLIEPMSETVPEPTPVRQDAE